ncbi:MAG: hypothetical protein ABH810_01750 [bacterium]
MEFEQKTKKSTWWVWLIVVVVIVATGIYIYINIPVKKTSQDNEASIQTRTASETWTRSQDIVLKNTTSSDTHKLTGGTFRMYYMNNGKIVYADSSDTEVFTDPVPTGISENEGTFISNPAVLMVSEGNWIMIYEQQPIQPKGLGGKTPPGPSTQRNLYLATSIDGKSFTKSGLAIDSSKDDEYFASVPDLVLLPDGQIRMYYVSGGEAVASALSPDGKTFTRENGYRLENSAVDPDVLIKDGKWIMYYSNLNPQKNGLYKAYSSDGLNWTEIEGQVVSKTGDNAIVDPDVVETANNEFVMFFGESSGGSSTGGDQINLYRATYSGNIF